MRKLRKLPWVKDFTNPLYLGVVGGYFLGQVDDESRAVWIFVAYGIGYALALLHEFYAELRGLD